MLSSDEFNSTLRQMKYEDGVEICLYQLECELRQKICSTFRRSISKIFELIEANAAGCSRQSMDIFIRTVDGLYNEVEKYWLWAGSRDVDGKFRTQTVLLTKTLLCHSLWPELRRVVRFVYEKTFAAFYQSQNRGKVPLANPEDGCCNICEKMKTKCECWYLVTKFRTCNERLLRLELLDRVAGITVIEIASSTIEERVKDICGALFDTEHVDTLQEWLESSLFKWLEEVYVLSAQSTKGASSNRKRVSLDTSQEQRGDNTAFDDDIGASTLTSRRGQFEEQKRRLMHYLHEAYGSYLIDKLFDIIIDYPESKPALIDLKRCLTWSTLRSRLTDGLKASLERRLLHPGVNTADILSAYIQTVYSLRVVDPTGVLMENVCYPLRQYLRQRTDTVRCIVSYLTGSGGLEMNSTLAAAGDVSLSFNDSSTGLASTNIDTPAVSARENEDEDWMQWQPDPVDAAPESIGRARRSADVISMLVGVYGSREQFVKEYCQLLAERLLRSTTYEIDDELRYLELLKLRLGEAELNQCEVMLKDVRDSQRINSFVNSQPSMAAVNFGISALVYSSYFWPPVKDDRLPLPATVTSALEAYGKCFEMQKASRTLEWKTQLGVVELEVQLGDCSVTVNVTPALATIIMLFEQKDTWTVDELAAELKAPVNVVRRRISCWTGMEIIREINSEVYQLCNELPSSSLSKGRRFSLCVDDDDDDESGRASTDVADKVGQLEKYWPYIMGLLTSFEELAGERIHTLLRMFCSEGQEPSLETVHSFLQKKVREQQLVYVGGSYKLQRK